MRHPLLVPREEKNVLLIVVSGDKGFAGAFNSNIIKAANRFIAAQNGEQGRESISKPSAARRGISSAGAIPPRR